MLSVEECRRKQICGVSADSRAGSGLGEAAGSVDPAAVSREPVRAGVQPGSGHWLENRIGGIATLD